MKRLQSAKYSKSKDLEWRCLISQSYKLLQDLAKSITRPTRSLSYTRARRPVSNSCFSQ